MNSTGDEIANPDLDDAAMGGDKDQPEGELFKIDSQSLARLAQGSSVLIASLLSIPDAFALIPGATSPLGWMLKLIGVWISAAVLWFVGFLGILHIVRLIVRGVTVSPDGIKLWRLARPIRWERLDAVSVEEQLVFSKLFSLKPPARKLTLYSRFKSEKKIFKKILVPQPVPSFFFKPADFERMVRKILETKFAINPASVIGSFNSIEAQPNLRTTAKALRYQQILITIFIGFGLVGLLGRKATVNYVYNSGNQVLLKNDLPEAERLYKSATEIDPFFYAPFNNLGNVQFRRGKTADAVLNWQHALALKPDFVEPMISLSHIQMQKRDYVKAKELINSALVLAPLNAYAMVNRADYFVRLGQLTPALRDARHVLAQQDTKDKRPFYTAKCIEAECLALSGKPQKALEELSTIERNINSRDFNRTSFFKAKIVAFREAGNTGDALTTALLARQRIGETADILTELTRLYLANGNSKEAKSFLQKLRAPLPADGWGYLLQAKYDFANLDSQSAHQNIEKAMQVANNNATLLAEGAWLFEAMGKAKEAQTYAKQSLEIEPLTDSALKLMQKIESAKTTNK
ncbi:MAG: hypothetical protein IAF58_14160 [Leptolyngbya sp.]|nr:hypothetical protein [Candidatus Melainabacteria bacterium]